MTDLDWNYYVGDPCYVIHDELWSDFCEALWAEEAKCSSKEMRPIYIPNLGDYKRDKAGEIINVEQHSNQCAGPHLVEVPCQTNKGEFHTVEVWDSPGGDGTWPFDKAEVGADGGTPNLGVDAGLLAVVPREACDPSERADILGMLFFLEPTLETFHNNHADEVRVNNVMMKGMEECECGQVYWPDDGCWCDGCGYGDCGCGSGCYGCESCDECGNMSQDNEYGCHLEKSLCPDCFYLEEEAEQKAEEKK